MEAIYLYVPTELHEAFRCDAAVNVIMRSHFRACRPVSEAMTALVLHQLRVIRAAQERIANSPPVSIVLTTEEMAQAQAAFT